MFNKNQFLLPLALILCCCCNPKPQPSLNPFIDKFQVFMHRVNDPYEALLLLPHYTGLELDVFFDYTNQCFIVKHDEDGESTLTLENYFTVCQGYPNAKYWIDFKNLKKIHSLAPISRLNYLNAKFNLKNRIIIESKDAEKLHNIGREGYFTSYWITPPSKTDTKAAVSRVKNDLANFQFNALSGNEKIASFFQTYFSDYTHHYWTSKKTDEITSIYQAQKDEKCKILLVDDREVFQKVTIPKL